MIACLKICQNSVDIFSYRNFILTTKPAVAPNTVACHNIPPSPNPSPLKSESLAGLYWSSLILDPKEICCHLSVKFLVLRNEQPPYIHQLLSWGWSLKREYATECLPPPTFTCARVKTQLSLLWEQNLAHRTIIDSFPSFLILTLIFLGISL